MSRLLVTGGAGFIGANFIHYWVRHKPEDRIVVLDALTYAGNRASLAPLDGHVGFRFVHGDIRDRELVEDLLRTEQIQTIVHFAAESHVDRSIDSPDVFVEVNVAGTHSLLRSSLRAWLGDSSVFADSHRFHHVSTDEVYGSLLPEEPPFNERTAYAPNSPYAATKAASDHLVRAYSKTYGLRATISNCSNNYGPYQFPEKLIPLCLVNLLQGRELPLYGDGLQVRDWLYVEDHCRGIERILARGVPGRTYNLGGAAEQPNRAVIELLCRIVDEMFLADPALLERFPAAPPAAGEACETRIRTVRDRPGHDRRYAIDGALARRELGFAPRIGLENGLRATVRWYISNESWWRSVLDGSYREWMERQYGG